MAGDYAELEKAFLARSSEDMAKCLEAHGDAFRADGNWGLACQVAAALPGRAVHRLTSTYLTLPLTDLAAAAGLQGACEAEALVRHMVARGEIFASLDARAGMVAFREEPEQFCTAAVAQRIQAQLDAVLALAARVQALDEALLSDTAYVAKELQLERQAAPGAGGAFAALDAASGGHGVAAMAAAAAARMMGIGDVDME